MTPYQEIFLFVKRFVKHHPKLMNNVEKTRDGIFSPSDSLPSRLSQLKSYVIKQEGKRERVNK